MEVSKDIESAGAGDVNRWSLSTEYSNIPDVDGYSEKAEVSLEEKGEKIHEIFHVEHKYMQQRATPPTPKSFNMSTKLHTEQFLKVMEAYQGSLRDPSIQALNLRGKHSWDDVLRVAKDAEATYLAVGGLRKAGRFITNNSEAVLPYLELIPNGFYTSMLCGGLKLAAARISEKRKEVLGTLLRIPNVIAQAERCVELFPSDPALYDRAADLYVAALAAIEGATGSLMQKPAWKQVRAMMQGPLYTKSFKEKIEGLNEALDALQERVSTLRDGSIVRTEKAVDRMETVLNKVETSGDIVDSTTKATLQHVHELNSEMKSLSGSAEQNISAVSSITQDLKILTISQDEAHLKLDETHVKIDHLRDLQQARDEAKRAMMIVLEETTKTSEWMREKERAIRRLKKQIERLEMVAAALSQEDLLEILCVRADSSIQDLQRMIRAGLSTELSAIHVAQGIIESERFKTWISTNASTTLFIEDGSSSASSGRNTPMSLMSSMVIEILHDKEPAIPIHFFCGSHTSSKDLTRGPQGMIRSLICQILRLFKVELDFIHSRRYRTQLESFDLHTLCDCFVKLVRKLPMDAVLVCIIDSISFFENEEWAENCRQTINDLQDLAEDDELGPVFKLLITSPLRSRYVGGMLPPQCRITLAADDLKGRYGPTERQISMRSRRSVRLQETDYYDR